MQIQASTTHWRLQIVGVGFSQVGEQGFPHETMCEFSGHVFFSKIYGLNGNDFFVVLPNEEHSENKIHVPFKDTTNPS